MPGVAWAKVFTQVLVSLIVTATVYVLTPKPKAFRQKARSYLTPGTGTVLPWKVVYGTTRLSGNLVFTHRETNGTDQKDYLWQAFVVAKGPCVNEAPELWKDHDNFDSFVSWAAEGSYGWKGTTAKGVTVWYYYGDDDQTVCTDLDTASTQWTSNMRLRGHAYYVVRMEDDAAVWPDGQPEWSIKFRGKADVYDPRTDTTGFTANAALCLADYLYNPLFGMASGSLALPTGYTEVDDADLVTAANVCDEAVNLNGGGTQPRYEINGAFEVDADRRSVAENMLWQLGVGSTAFWSQGSWHIIAGAHTSPVGTITEEQLVGPVQVITRATRSELFNTVKGVYACEQEAYLPQDYPVQSVAAYVTEDGEELDLEADFLFETERRRVQRLAKMLLYDARQQITVKLECNLEALIYRPGDRVNLTLDRYGWTDKIFRVQEASVRTEEQGGAPVVKVGLLLKETASAIYDWDETTDELTVDPAPDTELIDLTAIDAPTGLALTNRTTTSDTNVVENYVRVQWTDPLASHLHHIEVRWNTAAAVPSANQRWEYAQVLPGVQEYNAGPFAGGSTVYFHVRAVSNSNVVSAWLPVAMTGQVHTIPDDATSYTGLIAGRRGLFIATAPVFHDAFPLFDNTLSQWTQLDGAGNFNFITTNQVTSLGTEALFDGAVRFTTVDDKIPFDPDALFMIEARVRTNLVGAVNDDLLSIGILGYKENGTTKVAKNGADSDSNAHYFAAKDVDMGSWTNLQWYVVRGFFSGWGASVGDDSLQNDPEEPGEVHPDVRLFKPLLQFMWDASDDGDATGGRVGIDYIRIVQFDADTFSRTWRAVNTSGRLRGTRFERTSDNVPVTRGMQTGLAQDGDSVTFSPAFDEVPTIVLVPEDVLSYNNSWSANQKLILRADDLTASGFTLYAKVAQTTSGLVARNCTLTENSPPVDVSGDNITGTKTEAAEAVDDVYTFQYDVYLDTALELPRSIRPAQVALEFQARNSGGSWVTYAYASYTNDDPDNTYTVLNETKPITVDGLVANAEFRILLVDVTIRCIKVEGDQVDWQDATGPPTTTSATPAGDNKVRWQALEGS